MAAVAGNAQQTLDQLPDGVLHRILECVCWAHWSSPHRVQASTIRAFNVNNRLRRLARDSIVWSFIDSDDIRDLETLERALQFSRHSSLYVKLRNTPPQLHDEEALDAYMSALFAHANRFALFEIHAYSVHHTVKTWIVQTSEQLGLWAFPRLRSLMYETTCNHYQGPYHIPPQWFLPNLTQLKTDALPLPAGMDALVDLSYRYSADFNHGPGAPYPPPEPLHVAITAHAGLTRLMLDMTGIHSNANAPTWAEVFPASSLPFPELTLFVFANHCIGKPCWDLFKAISAPILKQLVISTRCTFASRRAAVAGVSDDICGTLDSGHLLRFPSIDTLIIKHDGAWGPAKSVEFDIDTFSTYAHALPNLRNLALVYMVLNAHSHSEDWVPALLPTLHNLAVVDCMGIDGTYLHALRRAVGSPSQDGSIPNSGLEGLDIALWGDSVSPTNEEVLSELAASDLDRRVRTYWEPYREDEQRYRRNDSWDLVLAATDGGSAWDCLRDAFVRGIWPAWQ